MLRLLILLAFLGMPLPAQTTYRLDPHDVQTYAEWCKREWRVATKMNTPQIAAQIWDHQQKEVAVIPTQRETGQTGKEFWTEHAPAWWRRMVSSWPFGSPTPGEQGNQKSITKLFEGIDSYQKARSALRAMTLMRQALGGLRFNINAWTLLKQIYAWSDDVVFTKDGQDIRYSRGIVSIGIVPTGKEGWRNAVAALQDDPLWDDPGTAGRIRYIGPRSWKDVALEADETYITEDVTNNPADPEGLLNTPENRITALLMSMEAATKAAADGLTRIRAMAARRHREVAGDALSSRRLARNIQKMHQKQAAAYNSVIALRALLEGRSASAVAQEYEAVNELLVRGAKSDLANAELSAEFYLNQALHADNVVKELMDPDYIKSVTKLEQSYIDTTNQWSQVGGVLTDIDSAVRSFSAVCTSLFPALVPYVGAVMMPVDVALVSTGNANKATGDESNDANDMSALFRDAQARALGTRLSYHLWEELRAARQLAYIAEVQRVAANGLTNERQSQLAMQEAVINQHELALAVFKLRAANDRVEAWGNPTPGGGTP